VFGACAVLMIPFLKDKAFEPEATRRMAVAYEEVCRRLGLIDKEDRATEIVAQKIIELAGSGESDPGKLRDAVLKEFKVER
jgi:hypothetical protein